MFTCQGPYDAVILPGGMGGSQNLAKVSPKSFPWLMFSGLQFNVKYYWTKISDNDTDLRAKSLLFKIDLCDKTLFIVGNYALFKIQLSQK